MVTQLYFKSGNYFCKNCMMKWIPKSTRCTFCGYAFSNYESVLLEILENENKNEMEFHFENNLSASKN